MERANEKMRSCLAFCKGGGERPVNETTMRSEEISVTCGACGAVRTVGRGAAGFVCGGCRCVNRLGFGELVGEVVSREAESQGIILEGGVGGVGNGPVMLRRMGSGIFQLQPDLPAPPMSTASNSSAQLIPNCSVCLEGAGDVVVTPCAHGGLCEPCARHIAGNAAVGGAHCPKCRKDIDRVLRLSRILADNTAVGVALDIPLADKQRAPPKVPPPPGYKKKNNNQ